jgi:hypothetical protein
MNQQDSLAVKILSGRADALESVIDGGLRPDNVSTNPMVAALLELRSALEEIRSGVPNNTVQTIDATYHLGDISNATKFGEPGKPDGIGENLAAFCGRDA